MNQIIKKLMNGHTIKLFSFGSTKLPLGIFFLFVFLSLFIFLFLSIPIVMLFSSFTFKGLEAAFHGPHLISSLGLSLLTTTMTASLIFIFGTPLAYILSRYTFPFKNVVNLLVDLPMVIPPSVAGIGLLVAFGHRSLIGSLLNQFEVSISFTMAAVILAQLFISAPFYIRSAVMGFNAADQELEVMARSLGAGWIRSFKKVTFPLAKPYLISGLLTSWARALGEFGATMMFAGNMLGKTETMPLAIYSVMSEDMNVANVLAIFLLTISIGLMTIVKLIPIRNDVI